MKRLLILILFLPSLAYAQHSHVDVRGMHDIGDATFLACTELSGSWTCSAGSTSCTGSGGDAATELDDGDIIELQSSNGWERFEVNGEPSGADALDRQEYYGAGQNRTRDLLYAVSGSTLWLCNDGLTSALKTLTSGSGGVSTLRLSTTDVASAAIGLTAGASVTENSDGYLTTGSWSGTIGYSDFSTAATTNDVTLVTLPANALLQYMILVVDTPATFADTYILSIGSSGSYDQIITDSDGKAAADTVYGDSDLERGSDLPDADHMGSKLYSYTATQAITIRADGNATNLDQASAGEWTVHVVYVVMR